MVPKLLILGVVAVAAVVGLSALGQHDTVIVSPMATVDDVYAAVSSAMGGATPDYDTQVKPVLDRDLTYQQLQDLAKSGGLAAILAATPAPAAAAAVTAAPAIAPAPAVTTAPTAARTVPMTAVLSIIRSQWTTQPQPITGTRHGSLSSLTCDRTGDVTVPANLTCTYVDATIPDPTKPGTLAVGIDANNAVTWLGCSTDPGTHFYQLCLQAAPTTPPVVAPPAGNVATTYCGREWITISIVNRPSPVWIYIDGRGPFGPNIVNTYRVVPGTHVLYWIYGDGTRSPDDNVYVGTCGSALININ